MQVQAILALTVQGQLMLSLKIVLEEVQVEEVDLEIDHHADDLAAEIKIVEIEEDHQVGIGIEEMATGEIEDVLEIAVETEIVKEIEIGDELDQEVEKSNLSIILGEMKVLKEKIIKDLMREGIIKMGMVVEVAVVALILEEEEIGTVEEGVEDGMIEDVVAAQGMDLIDQVRGEPLQEDPSTIGEDLEMKILEVIMIEVEEGVEEEVMIKTEIDLMIKIEIDLMIKKEVDLIRIAEDLMVEGMKEKALIIIVLIMVEMVEVEGLHLVVVVFLDQNQIVEMMTGTDVATQMNMTNKLEIMNILIMLIILHQIKVGLESNL